MPAIRIEKYTPSIGDKWNTLVSNSRNATFLHYRGFMDYHADRFDDFSLVALDDRDNLLAALPACRQGDTLVSHAGLTYGGWILPFKHLEVPAALEIFDLSVAFLLSQGIKTVVYKPVPYIYHRQPSDEDLYALFLRGAKQTACSLSAAIDLDERLPLDRGNRHNINVAKRLGITIERSDDWARFWELLSAVLMERHGLSPVHTLDEILLLHSRFPDEIQLWTASLGEELVAGTVMFNTSRVAHAQYIASSTEGRHSGALSLLFDHLISLSKSREMRYLDFGVSTEEGGKYLNEGLMAQKYRLGARAIAYPTFELKF